MITLYRQNRLDRAEQHDPAKLAEEFVATLRGEVYPDYEPSGSIRIDDQLIWWLSHPEGMDSTWFPHDLPPMLDALGALLDSDESARRAVLDCVNPKEPAVSIPHQHRR